MTRFQILKIASKWTIVLLCKIIFTLGLSAKELELELTEAKAHYTIEVAKHIEWPNEAELSQFTIAILGYERGLMQAFQERSSTKVRGKTFKVTEFDENAFNADQYAIVFIVHNKRSLNSRIFQASQHSLIVFDGKVSHEERMVSLETRSERLDIKLNRENLSSRGFEISISLLEFAGTKEDLGEELRVRQSNLALLQQEVAGKQRALEQLNRELTKNQQTLAAAEKALKNNQELLAFSRSQLNKLEQEIANSRLEVNKNEADITLQSQLIKNKQVEVREKAEQVEGLKKSIEQNKIILAQQFEKISQQMKDIQSRDETILTQRTWMQVILSISIVFIVMSYILYKMNKLRNQANENLKKVNSQLFELATTDSLTELSNRRYFLESAQKEIMRIQRKKGEAVLLMMDIDRFKKVNDEYGHMIGDKVIKTVAEVLRHCMRRYDIVGRLGGEEFAMMLMDCDIQQAQEIANRILKKVAENEVRKEGIVVKVTVSIGLSAIYKSDSDVEQGLTRADDALYLAKERGRNQIVVAHE